MDMHKIRDIIVSKAFASAVITFLTFWFGENVLTELGIDRVTAETAVTTIITLAVGLIAWSRVNTVNATAKLEDKVVDVREQKLTLEQELAAAKRALAAKEMEVESLRQIPPSPAMPIRRNRKSVKNPLGE